MLGRYPTNIAASSMTLFIKKLHPIIFYFTAVLTGLISVFFIYYALRLLYITHGLTVINTGGQGAYIGAVAFPLLAAGSGYIAARCITIARRTNL